MRYSLSLVATCLALSTAAFAADPAPAPAPPAGVTAAKTWFAPDQPLRVSVDGPGKVTLALTTFSGQTVEAKGSTAAEPGATVDLKAVFPQVASAGTFVLYAVPDGKALPEFVGTPLVIGVRDDKRPGAPAGPVVTKVEPLRYASLKTAGGTMTLAFYYDVAPNTANSFLTLAEGGYFDGLSFHRILPGFVLQGGDPRGDGTGGPGYGLPPEFSDRPHVAGALSMARQGDPGESPGVPPRYEFAASAGSQFFVCLNYENTKQLDGRYTVFGKVVDGMDVATAIGNTPLKDPRAGTPAQRQTIEKVEVRVVTPGDNPYEKLKEAVK